MIRRAVLHPFLLAVYPLLALYASNVYEARPTDLIAPVALVLALTALLWGVAWAAMRDRRKAGLIVSLLIVIFFGLNRAVEGTNSLLTYLTSFWVPYYDGIPFPFFLVAIGVIVLASWFYVARRLKDPGMATAVLNAFAFALIVLPVTNAVAARPPIQFRDRPPRVPAPLAPLAETSPRPDIYYIILDSYARSDVMKALFDFDNRPFLDRLKKKGFFIAEHATANYCQTRLCLSCSLNGTYLDELVRDMGQDQTGLADLIGKNDVLETLRPLGYRFVTFSSGFQETDHPEADRYFTPEHQVLSGFQRLLITTTPFGSLLPAPKSFDRFEVIRARVLYQLDHLPDVAEDPSSTFTFAHFMCPHPPFIFGEDGEDTRPRDARAYHDEATKFDGLTEEKDVYRRGYRDQAVFITKRIEQTIDRILEKSPTPPIIILQSDHGSGLNLNMLAIEGTDFPERMSILNAYYFPGGRYERLYDTISPVNSFRVVLNTFFGSKLGLLEDKSYFSTWPDPYRFHDVTAQVVRRDYPRASQGIRDEDRHPPGPVPASR